MKHLGINFSIKKHLKKNRVKRYSVTYNEAKKVCVLFTARGNEKFKAVNRFISKFSDDGKDVDAIYFLSKNADKPDVGLDESMVQLNKRDVGFFGNIKNEKAGKKLLQAYDYFIHADTDTTVFTDLILAACKAKCRIGAFHEEKGPFYDFMIKIDNEKNLQDLLKEIYHYTKSI
ncbi:MAG TPA: hypothetical protein DDY13_05550 [Cytophagales bacterium]|jgi:hypothetical protein|nr:hypothetical protein [Cytophagales bacterium]